MSLTFGPIFSKFSSTIKLIYYNNVQRNISCFKNRNSKNVRDISPYIIVRANRDDFPQIIEEMHLNYYDEEPTCTALNIRPNPILDERTLRSMQEGFTIIARCKHNGNIVGACINESTSPWDPDLEDKLACTSECENVRKLLKFYAYLMRTPNLYDCLGVNKVFEMSQLFINKSHRRKGLAYRLLKNSKSLGADAGFPVVRCDATSHHTAKICERLGMQNIAEIPYCTYLDQNLQPIFKPPWPHESVKIYCDCSPQFNDLKEKIKDKKSFFNVFKRTGRNKQKK